MFGVSGAELMVILLVGLIVLGPDRLPVVARKAGEVLGDLRRVSSGFEAEVRTALFEAENPDRYRSGTTNRSVADPPAADSPSAHSPSTDSPAERPGSPEPWVADVGETELGETDSGEVEPHDPAS